MAEINLDGYIKIRNALDAIQNSTHPNCNPHINDSWEAHVLGVVMNVKTEDVVPVRRGRWIEPGKHGIWIYGNGYLECDQCHEVVWLAKGMKFCPHCGADMREDGGDGQI